MLNEQTLQHLTDMKLHAMAAAFAEWMQTGQLNALSFDEYFGMIVDREWSQRQNQKLKTRLAHCKLREQACAEDIDYRHPRGLDRSVIHRLLTNQWVRSHENIIITGTSGLGKTWLACALVHKACREGHSALYLRVPRLLQELLVARGCGTYAKVLERFAKPDILVLDDFGLAPLTDNERRDLLEVIEDRHGRRSVIMTSQLEVKHWHELIGEPTVADAILDRLVSTAHRIELRGKTTMRTKSQSELSDKKEVERGDTNPIKDSIKKDKVRE